MLVQTLRKTLPLIAIPVLFGTCSSLLAASSATVYAVQPSAWLQQGDTVQVLKAGYVVDSGDRIITGEDGRIEIRIDDWLSLQQNTGSEVVLQPEAPNLEGEDQESPDVLVQAGWSCIEVHRAPPDRNRFVVALGNTMSITLFNEGRICVIHQDGLSSVHLREGSVQIVHSVDPNIIVLSESGSEFEVEFGESYSVLLPEVGQVYELASEGFPIPEELQLQEVEDKPEVVEEETEVEPVAATEIDPVVDASAPSYDASSKYVYTVYLFSTRDEDVANDVNQRFHGSGIPTEIYTTESDGTTRYRVVVTGFSSRDAARGYSDSMIGKHGIADTWIGRNKREPDE